MRSVVFKPLPVTQDERLYYGDLLVTGNEHSPCEIIQVGYGDLMVVDRTLNRLTEETFKAGTPLQYVLRLKGVGDYIGYNVRVVRNYQVEITEAKEEE